MPILDEERILAQVDGDRELLREVVELFLESCPRQQEELRAALVGGDAAEVARAAHAIKGSVSFFAAGEAVELARRLELIARSADLTRAREAYTELDAAMRRLTAALAAYVGIDRG